MYTSHPHIARHIHHTCNPHDNFLIIFIAFLLWYRNQLR